MLFKYNDGETTYILQTSTDINVDQIDYISDMTAESKGAAVYMQDGESIHLMDVIATEQSTEEPHLEVL